MLSLIIGSIYIIVHIVLLLHVCVCARIIYW